MTNPFFSASELPFELPPFADIRDEHYLEAFERGMAEQLDELEAIVSQPEPASFENTMIPLERSGQLLERVATVFFALASADSTDFINELEEELAPRLADHADAIRLDPRLFARIESLHSRLDDLALDAESRYLVERYYIEFTVAGAGLDEADKTALREYNQRLSTLSTRFEKNLLADTNDLAVHVTDIAELDGLGAGEISAAAEAARERGLDGHLVTLVLPTGHPYLSRLTRRGVRERIMTASRSRGSRGGGWDNRELVLDIARVRAERARLLGFDSHAAWVIADETAKTPETVWDLLSRLAEPAARNAREEQRDLEALAGYPVEAHDWAYLSEKVRSARFEVDEAALSPYFEAERVLRDGVFFAATELYGITFTERTDLPLYHPDVRAFEVRENDGTAVGLFLLDLYTRDSKRGGAWMNSLSSASRLLGHPAVVTNTLNVPKPAAGEPTLLTLDEVETLFHEFGHALHGLFARVEYPKFAGTNTYRDFVEFPSQVNEMWMLWPEVLENYAIHHETGERMPLEALHKLQASAEFNQGFSTSEYLAAAILDQAWHRLSPAEIADVTDVAAFESAALADAGLDNPAVPTRYGSTYFAHVFSGGYDAGYYSYIWSEVLDADTVEWFRDNGGLTLENGKRFRERLLAVGGSRDPLEAFRDFRGRDADIAPLLRRRALD
ncbi:peptidyl-dipeptidase Dcp [Microbacteriaceae bacterium SG_E_30_P1]|uniref:Peptidyl-dipeptidase Dcp n=1 Tax=Antiquaquibacter oligotrophicus TaxID=2880260 RepID=A0ABT6KN69_9MICO|nr:M3 family metallopeptidase [Antiquaquibacter oligotrophicus]MDH6181241.1 peptidyl-dipeptidase Dcp [Antiquaquibacter oligotrophicus]UDF13064.1 M3 family metallopeptidase [Antiquaquibacter oligotrophicus]